MLTYLPQELLLLITAQLSLTNLNRLRAVNKYLYAIITPSIYNTVKIATYGPLIDHIDVKKILRATSGRKKNLLHYVRELAIVSTFRSYCLLRCPHFPEEVFRSDSDSYDAEDPVHLRSFENLTQTEALDKARWMDDGYDASISTHFNRLKNRVLSVLIKCQEGGLQTFGWALGTCIPAAILGKNGYLPTRQKNLETFILVTDGNCSHMEENQIDLTSFSKLKALSWTGLKSPKEFQVVRQCLAGVSQQLEALKLDVLTWKNVCKANRLANLKNGAYLAQDVFQVSPADNGKCTFPVVVDISFNGLSLISAERELAAAFNFGTLRYLKLRFCPGWENFLRHATSQNKSIYLRQLVIQSDGQNHSTDKNYHSSDPGNESDEEMYINNFDNSYDPPLDWVYKDSAQSIQDLYAFLDTVNGIEALEICINRPTGVLPIWEALERHKASLRTLVYHHRSKNQDIPAPSGEVDDLSILGDPRRSPLRNVNLQFLGLCCHREELKAILSPFTSKNSLTVLHIRESRLNYSVCESPWAEQSKNQFYDHEVNDIETRIVIVDEDYVPRDYAQATEYFHEFMQWAFGPQGIPSLQVIAYGDWSFHGRYMHSKLAFCRVPGSSKLKAGQRNHKAMNSSDGPQWALIDECEEFLQSCPVNFLLNVAAR